MFPFPAGSNLYSHKTRPHTRCVIVQDLILMRRALTHDSEVIDFSIRIVTLDSPAEDLPRMSVGCHEEDMTGYCLGPQVIKRPSVFRQSSMGCAMEAPSSPAAMSSCTNGPFLRQAILLGMYKRTSFQPYYCAEGRFILPRCIRSTVNSHTSPRPTGYVAGVDNMECGYIQQKSAPGWIKQNFWTNAQQQLAQRKGLTWMFLSATPT